MPITFDTAGLRRHDQNTWFHDATGDRITVVYQDHAADLPAPLEDPVRLRHGLALRAAETGCLVEAHVVVVSGTPALLRIVKAPLPDQPAGQVFVADLTVPRATGTAVLTLHAAERGVTGAREAALMAQLGVDRWLLPHPYAPEAQSRLPYHAGDDARFDPQFPDHPLTRVRAWAHHAVRTAQLDPRFAAQPPFTPRPPEEPVTKVITSDAHRATPPSGPVPVTPYRAEEAVTTALPTPRTGIPVVAGLPIGEHLALWHDGKVGFWRVADPDALLAALGTGALERMVVADNRFRDVLGFAENAVTLPDGRTVVLTRVSEQDAVEAVTPEAVRRAFGWIGWANAAAADRGEYLVVEPGEHTGFTDPYVLLMVRQQEGGPVAVAQTSPAPAAGMPYWQGTSSLSAPATPESVGAGGTLALYAFDAWDVHPLRLCLTYGPVSHLVPD
ncbi:hypothetical protein [Actinosynnema sp. NPDC020468]|uniref:hypothetical protein n=1 Tax=Actinosynnema sp. NPDC020468 TaxID=3154488 RepID=UPI0033C72EA5